MYTRRAPILGATVTEVRFDFAFTLAFDAKFLLRFETRFEVAWPDGAEESTDPETDHGRMGRLILLHNMQVVAVEADDRGAIRALFEDGTCVTSGPDELYEAWDLSGPDGPIWTSLPGGDLAVWVQPLA